MTKKYLFTLAAVLCFAMTMVVMTACSNDDDNLAPGVDKKIVGNWSSDVSGMTYAKWNYGKTWQNTEFKADGTGSRCPVHAMCGVAGRKLPLLTVLK